MTLHVIPIEPMEERYSAQWLKWFDQFFRIHPEIPVEMNWYDPFQFLETGTTVKINHGQFLDVVNTNIYKAQQLQLICAAIQSNRIKDGDVLLFLDGWFPGLEMLAYIRDGMKLNLKFVGMFHAGTYDPNDFLTQNGMGKWGRPLENAWFEIYDQIIVATEYHKRLIIESRQVDHNKIKVIFFPMLTDWIAPYYKKNKYQVIFPHRLAPEKCPNHFKVLSFLSYDDPIQFIISKHETQNKESYWRLLAESNIAVSFARQETYGIAQIESVLSDCIPIVPDRCSYSELYPKLFKYEGSDNVMDEVNQVKAMIQHFTKDDDDVREELNQLKIKFRTLGATSIPTIIHHCFSQ